MIKLWLGEDGWCVQLDGVETVWVYLTLASALRKVKVLAKESEKENK